MAAILNSANLYWAILVFPLKLTHTCQDWFPLFAQKKPWLIHSDSTWWWQPPWTLPSWIQMLPSWIQTPCYLLSDSLKNTLLPLWLWLKLMQSSCHCITCQDWFPPFAQKNFTHSFWLNLMIVAILKSAILNSAILYKKYFTHSFWLNLMMAAILKSAILDSAILHKKIFTHSFWLNFIMAANLKSAILDSDTAILDSDTLLSSLRFTQKHSHSTLTLTQTISICLKLIHSHLTWWWSPSWILPTWIWPPWIQPS